MWALRASQRSFRAVQVRGFSQAAVAEECTKASSFQGQQTLDKFEISPRVVSNLERAGITTLFPVQVESFETMSAGKDLVGTSKTGSGKTLAFALPIVEKIFKAKEDSRSSKIRAVIALPTRELALQVSNEFRRIAPQLSCVDVVGGMSYTNQLNALRRGADIVVCTPGRIIDLLTSKKIDLSHVDTAVLDEADMMLEIGFQQEVEQIFEFLPAERQTVLWSATFPKWVKNIAKTYLNDPEWLDLVGEDDMKIPATVEQKAVVVNGRHRASALGAIMERYGRAGQSLIFTETKREVEDLVRRLGDNEIRGLHGDMSQGSRTSTMQDFRDGKFKTIICTDIAARGLDISNVDLVVQYRLPVKRENFVHRAGRTGRAGRNGVNIVLLENTDLRDIQEYERDYGIKFAHVAIPSPADIVEQAKEGTLKRILDIPANRCTKFEDMAEELLQQHGKTALSAALAILSGYEKGFPKQYSLLTGKPRFRTARVTGGSKRAILAYLNDQLPESDQISPEDIHSVSCDALMVDIPNILTESDDFSIPNCTSVEFPTELDTLFEGIRFRTQRSNSRNTMFSKDRRHNARRNFGGQDRFRSNNNNGGGGRFGKQDRFARRGDRESHRFSNNRRRSNDSWE